MSLMDQTFDDFSQYASRYLDTLWRKTHELDTEAIRNIVLFNARHAYVLVFTLRCLLICRNIRHRLSSGQKSMYWLHTLVFCLLGCFGGSTVAPLLTGNVNGVLGNEVGLVIVLLSWYAVHHLPLVYILLTESLSPIRIAAIACAEVMRVHSVVGGVTMALAALEGKNNMLLAVGGSTVPLLGPIVLGTISGVSGVILTRGISAFRSEASMVLQNAFLTATVYHVLTNTSLVPQTYVAWLDGIDLRTVLMAHNAFIMIVRNVIGRQFNPYFPIHELFYTLSFINPDEGVVHVEKLRRRRSVSAAAVAASAETTAPQQPKRQRLHKRKVSSSLSQNASSTANDGDALSKPTSSSSREASRRLRRSRNKEATNAPAANANTTKDSDE